MYRHGRAAAAAAVVVAARLRPAGRLRAWPGGAAAAAGVGPGPQGSDPPRRRYRARPQPPPPLPPRHPGAGAAGCRRPGARALSPPEGLEGAITTVDGRREDDIAVRERPGAELLLLRPLARAAAAGDGAGAGAGAGAAGPAHRRRPQPSMEEHLALVHAKLQHELPNFFRKVHDFGLYSPDVEFVNRPLRLRTRGRPMYQAALALCRAAAWGYFASVRLEVLALTQHPEDWSVRARWRLTGLPFHLCLLRFYRRDKRDLLRSYDALSTFFLDSQGLIRCHHIDKLMPAPRAVAEAKKLLVAAAAAGLAQPGPELQLLLEPPGAAAPP
ncbi:uncharacterized protein C6orf136 homolog [Rhea pennata]|uniref:uncharacterized protein C6orf136 homolog n=1 Tax=Rhea pennata TaxID=8795 RepID=UPI002E265C58